jgi:hypothetical protein
MKPAQHPSRAASELTIQSSARRRPIARELNRRTHLISHPECKTRRWCTTGAPSCRQSPPFPNAIRDPSPETHDPSAPDHIHRRAMLATVEQRCRVGEGRQLEVHSRRRTMYRRRVIPSSPQYLDRFSPLRQELRQRITASIWIPSHRCPHRSRYG